MNRAVLFYAGMILASSIFSRAASDDPSAFTRYEFTQPQMGVPFKIILYAQEDGPAETAAKAAFKRIRELNSILSDYDPDSELSLLSKSSGTGASQSVSPELWFVLEKAQQLSAASDGAFDVTVGPCIELWRQARRTHRFPDQKKLSAARSKIGFTNIVFHPGNRSVELRRAGMQLDLGGIAKGYAADEAIKVLQQHGITRAFVAGSGDMAFNDPPPGQKGWRIEVAPLDVTNAPPKLFVTLAHAGIATSGDIFQRVELDGKRYSHIVDPKTGIGLTDHSLVTVIAPTGIDADGLATAISVLGPEKGLKLLERFPGAAAHIVRLIDGKIQTRESENFRNWTRY